MYLHNNYVCHFLQDYWKELVITAIKSKHNSASVVSCWWKVDCVYLYSSSFRFMIYEFCHCISYKLFFGPSKTEDKPPKIIKFYLEYLLIFKVTFPGGWGCIPVLLCHYYRYQCNPLSHSVSTLGWAPYQWNDKVSTGNWGNLKCEILTRAGAGARTDQAQ